MTVSKRKVAFGHSPVVDLVVRDGAWTFCLLLCKFLKTYGPGRILTALPKVFSRL